jgi:hypothetical protein
MKAVLAIALAVAIIIIIWMVNHPEVKVEKEIQYVKEYINVPVPVETPVKEVKEETTNVVSNNTSKKPSKSEMEASHTMKDEVKESAKAIDGEVAGKTDTKPQETEGAKTSEKNMIDGFENQKIQEEIKNDSSKKVVSDNDDISTVVGDDNTGTNPNTVEKQDESKRPFGNNTEKCETKLEEKTAEEPKAPVNTSYDLFANNETTEEKTEATPVAPKAPVVESTEVEATETPAATVVLPKEDNKVNTEKTTETKPVVEDKKTTEVAPVEVAKKEEATKSEKVEAPKAAKIANSYVSASKDATAVIKVDEGTIVSADAGDGVQVTISGNTVNVKLDTPENSIVDVDMVDSLGNSINAVVAFN